MRPDILILGVGRSGTSKIAEILHSRFGVCFGHDPSMLRDFRGETVYEDAGLKKMIKRVVKGDVGIDSWLEKFQATHKDCTAEFTGVKLLDFAALSIDEFLAIGPRLIVRTYRPFRSCVESWVRYRRGGVQTGGESREWAEDYVSNRETKIRTYLLPVLREAGLKIVEFDFDPEDRVIPDEELIAALGVDMENL
jgi:hypothetical protein